MRTLRSALLIAAAACAACRTTEPAPQPPAGSAPAPAAAASAAPAESPAAAAIRRVSFDPSLPLPPGLNEGWIDLKADPCQDFFQFACGGWLAQNEIPADQSRWGQFNQLFHRNLGMLREMLDQAAQGKAPEGTPYADKLKDYYGTCMDEPALERALPALKAELKALDAVKDPATLSAAITRLQARGWSWPFSLEEGQDFRDATQMIVHVDQSGLGLPERDYYLSDKPKMQEIRQRYLAHLEKLFSLLGDKAGPAKAKAVMELETALAKASMSNVDRRSPEKMYHRLEREGLRKAAPSFQWDPLFAALSLKDATAINVTHPPFFEALDGLIRATPPETWRAYLTIAVVRESVQALPKAFRDAEFDFTSKALTGATADLPRWRQCVQLTDHALGEALAIPFVNKAFGAQGKAQAQAMVKAVEAAFEANLQTLSWMDEETRARARDKLHQIANKIGYPDQWRRYDGLRTSKANFLANFLAGEAFNYSYRLSMVGKPVDRQRWLMTPPTVNAYYNPPLNEIVFPAGILQPPFYDLAASPPLNFGAIGMVVGHEITHGFDDEGRKYDAKGNLSQWWTDASDAAFRDRAACVERQYGGLVAIDDLKVNGALTLGENVADLGGVKLAFNAMQSQARAAGAGGAKYRYSPEQQFFLGYAHGWCSRTRPQNVRMRIATDPHSPPEMRVNVPLRNFAPFAQAFGCQPGDPMVLPAANRCEVW